MKKVLFILLFVFVASVAGARDKKESKKDSKKTTEVPVYIMGASISFSDSIVYFTEIQKFDAVVLENGFLPHRQYYAYELKDYMSFEENMPGRISVIYFDEKLKKLEKKEQKIKKHLMEKEGKTVRYLGDKFKFVKP
jgi:signal peptidase I